MGSGGYERRVAEANRRVPPPVLSQECGLGGWVKRSPHPRAREGCRGKGEHPPPSVARVRRSAPVTRHPQCPLVFDSDRAEQVRPPLRTRFLTTPDTAARGPLPIRPPLQTA